MDTIRQDMDHFRRQLAQGSLQRAYKALLSYMTGLRAHLHSRYPGYSISGLYQGYLDMTYFAIVPPSLKPRGLKIAIVFNYAAFRFEAWLAGEWFRDSRWPKYRVVAPAPGIDSIVECDLATDFDLSDPGALTSRIEAATSAFIVDMETFLAGH